MLAMLSGLFLVVGFWQIMMPSGKHGRKIGIGLLVAGAFFFAAAIVYE
jgi:hypothetical protein